MCAVAQPCGRLNPVAVGLTGQAGTRRRLETASSERIGLPGLTSACSGPAAGCLLLLTFSSPLALNLSDRLTDGTCRPCRVPVRILVERLTRRAWWRILRRARAGQMRIMPRDRDRRSSVTALSEMHPPSFRGIRLRRCGLSGRRASMSSLRRALSPVCAGRNLGLSLAAPHRLQGTDTEASPHPSGSAQCLPLNLSVGLHPTRRRG